MDAAPPSPRAPRGTPAQRDAPAACTVAVVMPAYQAEAFLPTTLPALLAAAKGAPVVVVDPGSTDSTAAIAESFGVKVMRLGRRAGPAEARNEGVALLDADVALFVDSDCIAHADVVDRVRRAFTEDPSLVSLTGSYDDSPPERNFFSQYMNLRHHRTHQRANRDGASFWAGCGAVRIEAFRRCGAFDAGLYPRPMIEDIELGLRLRELGATRLDPDLQVTHMKHWTLRSTVTTDVVHRALPWSRLILERGLPNDLNLRTSQRVAALVAVPAILSVPAIPVALATRPAWVALPLAVIAASVLLSFDLVAFFARRRGVLFGAGGWLFHQVHLVYSAATFAFVAAQRALGGGRSPSP